MEYYSTMTGKGQITIPASIRKKHGLDIYKRRLTIHERDGELVITLPPNINDLRKQLKDNLHAQGFTDVRLREMALNQQNG